MEPSEGNATGDDATGRRPRIGFQAAAEKATTRSGVAKLGLSTAQGVVSGIKMYAATHAAKEGAYAAMLAANNLFSAKSTS